MVLVADRIERLRAAFSGAEVGSSADDFPFVVAQPGLVVEMLGRLRGELGYDRFVDLTAVDDPSRPDRFELNYLVYSMSEHLWLRLKVRTAESLPSAMEVYPAANWYERELFDLFGIRFEGHPELERILMPDDWEGHPLRRDTPIGREPVDFTVTRDVYGT